jgi:MFS family permease
MDFAKVGTRKAVESTIDNDRSGIPFSYCVLLATAAFVQYFIGHSVIFWLPTILKNQSRFSDLQVGLFGAMPYVVALFAMLFNGWHSDKAGERRWHAAAPLLIAATGLLCLISLPSSNVMRVLLLSMICMAMDFCRCSERFRRKSSGTPTRQLQWEQSMRSPAWQVFAGRYAFGYLRAENWIFRRRVRQC